MEAQGLPIRAKLCTDYRVSLGEEKLVAFINWRERLGRYCLWHRLIGQRHVGSPVGYAPGNLSPLTRTRATYRASQQPRAATPGIPFDNQRSDRRGADLTAAPL